MDEPHGAAHSNHGAGCGQTADADTAVTAVDPVCGMTVDPAKTAHYAAHGGTDYHFCSAGCLAKFTADPAKYLADAPRTEAVAAPGAMWTCPMHPEIRRAGPGTCPFCGMALEPEEGAVSLIATRLRLARL